MKRPFAYLSIILISGIYLFYNLDYYSVMILSIISVIFIVWFILSRKNKYLRANISNYSYILLVTFITLIIGVFSLYNILNSSYMINFCDKYVQAEGVIKEEVSSQEYCDKYILEVKSVYYLKKEYKLNEKVVLLINDNNNYLVGDKISVRGNIRKISSNTNPRLFNYKLYLQSKHIYTQIVSDASSIQLKSHNNLKTMELMAKNFEKHVETVFDKLLESKNSNIMKSIVLGDTSYIDDELVNTLREIGVSHVLAISGLHIGIISFFILFVLKKVGLNTKVSIGITLVIIWIYAYFVNFKPSILRASILFSCLMTSNLTYRRYDSINSIALAAFILLIHNPLWLFSVGFQLSFVATLSIVMLTGKIKKLFPKKYKFISTTLSPLIAVQIGIFPIILYHFNMISVSSIICNLILIPIMSLCLIMGFIIIIFSFMNINLVVLLGIILNVFLNLFNIVLQYLDSVLPNSLILPSPTIIFICIYYILVLLIVKTINIEKADFRIKKVVYVYVAVFIVLIMFTDIINKKNTIHFLDVGQGDCTHVDIQNKNFLIDTGGSIFNNFDVGDRIVSQYLLKHGINKLDGVFITHFDADHCKGLFSMLDKIVIDNVYIGHINMDNELCRKLIIILKKRKININKITKGDKLIIDDNICFCVLNPSKKEKFKRSENNLSLVMLLNVYNNKVLFTGDIERDIEKSLIKGKRYDIDILKIAHHGSKTSSSDEFIKFYKPEYGVISVGNNNFGHPSCEVIDRFKDNNVSLFRTDHDGLVSIEFNQKGYKIHSFIRDKLLNYNILKKCVVFICFIFIYFIISVKLILEFGEITYRF